LVAPLYHDLHTAEKPIPPTIDFALELKRTSDDLFLQTFNAAAHAKKYKVIITEMKCFVPVSKMTEKVARGKFRKTFKKVEMLIAIELSMLIFYLF
jgi:hypothetical protein